MATGQDTRAILFFARTDKLEPSRRELIAQRLIQFANLVRDFVRSRFEKKFYRRAQSRENAVGIRARFEFPAAGFELHFALRDEIRRNDIPSADNRGSQQMVSAFFNVKNPGARRTEHPLLGPGAGEVDMLQ